MHIKRAVSNVLKNFASTGSFPRLIILSGPWGCGKTTIARSILARYTNCLQGPLQACLKCESCLSIDTKNNSDVWEVDAASWSSVNDIPAFKEWIQFKVRYRKKFLILDEAHRLSKQAWEALLKVTEEGSENACFVLCTTELDKVPNTIVSRSDGNFKLTKIGAEDLKTLAEKVASAQGLRFESEEALSLMVRKSEGHARDLMRSLEAAPLYSQSPDKSLITDDSVWTLFGVVKVQEAEKCLEAAFAKDTETYLNLVASNYTIQEDFCKTMIELLRQETYHRSLLRMEKFKTVKTSDLIRFLGFLEDVVNRMMIGESSAALYVAYERYHLNGYIEILGS